MLMKYSFINQSLLKRASINFFNTPSLASFSHDAVPAVKKENNDESYQKELKVFQTFTNVTRKTRVKKPQKPPFVKNLLLSEFDKDILSYPELNKEDNKNLEENAKLLKNVMKQSHMSSPSLSKSLRQNLSDYKAIGLQAPNLMDGLNCNVSESCRIIESLSENDLRCSIFNNEQYGVQTLVKFADDKLKTKYLTRLMNGEILSATCISEGPCFVDTLKTNAKLSLDGKTWILNGEKVFVVNAKSADVLIVFAVSKVITKDVHRDVKLTAFLVEKNSPGISINEIDTKGIEMANVIFTDTPIPAENVIGTVNEGQKLLEMLITEQRLSVSAVCATTTRTILNNMINEISRNSNNVNRLHETDNIRENMGKMAISLYAMESATYLTAGLLDDYTDQDVQVEAIISKVFASQVTTKSALSALDLLGLSTLSESHWLHPLLRDAQRFKTLHEPDEGLKIVLALLCLEHAGIQRNDVINRLRNPFFHINFNWRRMWTQRRNNADNPKLDLELPDHLHLSLEGSAQKLEYCVKRLEYIAEIMLVRYGVEVVNYHMELKRLADIIIDVYLMTACLGRASRSYCIGLQFAETEMLMAASFCKSALTRVKYNVEQINLGQYFTSDEDCRVISKKLFQYKEYFPKHPLTRNF